MKITKARLKEIIREEMNKLVATGEISIDETVLGYEEENEVEDEVEEVDEQTDKDIADRTPGDKPKDRKKPAS